MSSTNLYSMRPAFCSFFSAVWMTPSHGSSIGVAYAPKTLSVFAPPSLVSADSLSLSPPQPAAARSMTAARTTQHGRRRPDIRIRLLEIVTSGRPESRTGAARAQESPGSASNVRESTQSRSVPVDDVDAGARESAAVAGEGDPPTIGRPRRSRVVLDLVRRRGDPSHRRPVRTHHDDPVPVPTGEAVAGDPTTTGRDGGAVERAVAVVGDPLDLRAVHRGDREVVVPGEDQLSVGKPGGAAPIEALPSADASKAGAVGIHHEVGAARAGSTAPEGDLQPVGGEPRARLLEEVVPHRTRAASVPAHQVDPLVADEENRPAVGRKGGVVLESRSRVTEYPLARSVRAHEEQDRALWDRVRVHATALRREEPLEDDRPSRSAKTSPCSRQRDARGGHRLVVTSDKGG